MIVFLVLKKVFYNLGDATTQIHIIISMNNAIFKNFPDTLSKIKSTLTIMHEILPIEILLETI